LFPIQAVAQSVVSYKSDFQLPVDLYTADGVLLRKGRFDLEVGSENGHYLLFFRDKNKTIARLSGQTAGKGLEESKESSPSVPLVGTTLLLPDTPKEKGKGTTATVAPHLPNLSWKATLRAYKSSDPSDKTVRFIFHEKQDSGHETRVHFTLFLK
jgi:hypothetical protein